MKSTSHYHPALSAGTPTMMSVKELLDTDTSSPFLAFSYDSANLGDYIQTLALLQHLTVKGFVSRDSLSADPDSILIANGWVNESNIPAHEAFLCSRLVGLHVTPRARHSATAQRLHSHGTIGCRDLATLEFCKRHNIPCMLSNCATLTFPAYRGERENNVIFVDVTPKAVTRAGRLLRQPLKEVVLSHKLRDGRPNGVSAVELRRRFELAHEYLRVYRSASLVVTTRIHVALPCLAFGTPVLLFHPKDDRATIFDPIGLADSSDRFRWRQSFPWAKLELPVVPDVERQRAEFMRALGVAIDSCTVP